MIAKERSDETKKKCDRKENYDQSFDQASEREIQMAVRNDRVCYNDKAEQEDQEFTVIKEPNYNERPAYSQNHSPITKSYA